MASARWEKSPRIRICSEGNHRQTQVDFLHLPRRPKCRRMPFDGLTTPGCGKLVRFLQVVVHVYGKLR
jgi:hypothetical protein